jgi:hypothetical protein
MILTSLEIDSVKNKKRKVFFVLLFTILSVCAYVGTQLQHRTGIRNYKEFNNADIKGIIEYTKIKNQGSAIKVKGTDANYVFYPYTNEQLNGSRIFNGFAKPGDSIVKENYSDTLYLIKPNGSIYKYTFLKIKDE